MSRNLPLSEEEFEHIYSRVPRICVDLIIKNQDGILLTLRNSHGWVGQWHLPGGTIYIGESVQETIQRVAQEELGIELKVEKFLGYLEYHSEIEERGYGQSIALAFLCTPLSNDIKLDSLVSEFGFFTTLPEKTIQEQRDFISSQAIF